MITCWAEGWFPLASATGVGKTILTLQTLAGLGHQCLYTTGEETAEHVEGAARRIGAHTPQVSVLAELNLTKIFAHARAIHAQTIAIDSIQTLICEDVNGRSGSLPQLRECVARIVRYAKTHGTTLWLTGHVTGDGDIAGPKTIEYDVDVVLKLSPGAKFQGNERILRCPNKNRFGRVGRLGAFELTAKGFVPISASA